jgi:hypothetical protein
VHRPLGEQLEDGGANVATPTAATGTSSAAMTSSAGTARSERTRAEAGTKTESGAAEAWAAEAWAEAKAGAALAAVFPHVVTELFAHVPAGCAALVVPGAPVSGADER